MPGNLSVISDLGSRTLKFFLLFAEEGDVLGICVAGDGVLWCNGPSTQSANIHRSLSGGNELRQGLGREW